MRCSANSASRRIRRTGGCCCASPSSLDFVSALRLGDALPSEILTGEASWSPDPIHFQIAATQLRLQLVDWLSAGSGAVRRDLDAESLLQVEDDPLLRQQIQEALARAAATLGLAAAAEVVSRLEGLGRELAYIEALRDRLLRRVRVMTEKIESLSRRLRSNGGRVETVSQVRRLSDTALRQIAMRFDELDAQTGEVMSALRNADSQTVFIRSNRDWLYRSQRAWEPTLALWEAAGTEFDQETLSLLTRTYQFLAPRFMPVTEWISMTNPRRTAKAKPMPRMVW